MNDSAGNANETSRISYVVADVAVGGGSGGGTYIPSVPIIYAPVNESYKYSYETIPSPKISLVLSNGNKIQDYFAIRSLETNLTFQLDLTIECVENDDSCLWFDFLIKRELADQIVVEHVQQSYVSIIPEIDKPIIYAINIPYEARAGMHSFNIVLTDNHNSIKRLKVEIKVGEPLSFISFDLSFLNKGLFPIRDNKFTGAYLVTLKDGVTSILVILLLGMLIKIILYIYSSLKPKEATKVVR